MTAEPKLPTEITSNSLQADELPQASMRWLRPLAIACVLLVLAASFRSKPHPGLDGAGLGVTTALCCFAVATVLAIGLPDLRPAMALPIFTMLVLSSASLVGLQTGGLGTLGLFVAVAVAAMRVHGRGGAGVAALAMVSLSTAGLLGGHSSLISVANGELGIVAFYVLGVLGYRLHEGQHAALRLLAELEASRNAQAEAAVLAERARLAREMHDVLAHALSGLALQIAGARLLVDKPESAKELSGALDRAHLLARTGIDEARRAIGMLREDALPGPEGLAALAKSMELDACLPCRLRVTGEERELSAEVRLTLFRVAQEALANVRRHAKADRVEICLDYEPSGTALSVEDFGTACSGASDVNGSGYGLTGMRERAELLGGTLAAGPTGRGFRVNLWVPA